MYVTPDNTVINADDFQYMDGCKKIENMPKLSINEASILAALKSLKASNCPGPDNVPSIVLKNCAESLSKTVFSAIQQITR